MAMAQSSGSGGNRVQSEALMISHNLSTCPAPLFCLLTIVLLVCGEYAVKAETEFYSLAGYKINLLENVRHSMRLRDGVQNDANANSTLGTSNFPPASEIVQHLSLLPLQGRSSNSFKNVQQDQDQNESGSGGGGVGSDDGINRVKILPDQHHISGYLEKGVGTRFLFINDEVANPLSITITPCTSILQWEVRYWALNSADDQSGGFEAPVLLKNYRTQNSVTFSEPSASRGVYSVDIRPLHYSSFVHLFATAKGSLFGGTAQSHSHTPMSSQVSPHLFTKADLQLQPHDPHSNSNKNPKEIKPQQRLVNSPRIWASRLRGNRLHVKWDVSPRDPHLMHYCIVLNNRKDYGSLCSAVGERFGVAPPAASTSYEDIGGVLRMRMLGGEQYNAYGRNASLHRIRHSHSHRPRRSAPKNEDLVVGCVGKRNSYILSNLKEGMLYYFNVFVRDSLTNISYPYVRTTLKYTAPKQLGNVLKDAKPVKINLRSGSSQTLKFNLNKPCGELALYVIPCGGGPSLNFQLSTENQTLHNSQGVESFEILKVKMPRKGKYFLKLSRVGGADGSSSSGSTVGAVEVYLGKKGGRLPLPKLPAIRKVKEDESSRTCDSVTVQWWPSPDPRDNEYCIFLKEERKRPYNTAQFKFKAPNQCDVERGLKRDPYVSHSMCLQRDKSDNAMLISQKIVGLSPGRVYILHLIVRRYNGKSLAYDTNFVKTLKRCTEDQ